jgi:signal transduction histidine kinase
MPSWWSRRSLRLRVTAAATAVLAVGLVAGTIVLATLFVHRRVAVVDVGVRDEVSVVAQLVAAENLPSPLPAPAAANTLAQVLDPAGTVLASTASASSVLAILPIDELSRHLGKPFTTTSSSVGSTSLRVIAERMTLHGVPVVVVAASPLADVTATLDALRNVLIVAVPLVLLAAAAATWLAVTAALHPVERLRAAADAVDVYGAAEPPQLPIPSGGDELRRLGETLNDMLRRLHAATEQQRAFIADAAHELRSPLASLRTQLEVALTVPTSPSEWNTVGHGVLADVERLSRLADDLLLLARFDSGTIHRIEPVAVDALLRSVDAAAETREVTGIFVDGDEVALRRMLTNLTANARRHAGSHVAVEARLVGREVLIAVDDDGPGIPEAERERVFERWVRLDAGRGRDGGGAGLGLAIVRSVARAHGGDATLSASPLGGLRAVVRLPASRHVGIANAAAAPADLSS